MSYILNNDKLEIFECKLSLEGAELRDSIARVIIEANGHKLLYEGKIKDSGECLVEISNLKKIFPNETSGKLKLEVIADGDTYFLPHEEDITIKPSKSLTVETIKKSEPQRKPQMKAEVKRASQKPDINELCESLKSVGFTKKVIKNNKKKFIPVLGKVIREYYKSLDSSPEKGVIKEILNKL